MIGLSYPSPNRSLTVSSPNPHLCTFLSDHTHPSTSYHHAVSKIKTRDDKWTPLHFAARYRPRYQDETEQDLEEERVTYLSSSKRAVQFLIKFCQVNVSLSTCVYTDPSPPFQLQTF